MSRPRCTSNVLHDGHYVPAKRTSVGRIIEGGFDCPGLPTHGSNDDPRFLPLDRPHGYPRPGATHDRCPGYFSTLLPGEPRPGAHWTIVGVWHDDRESAHRALSGHINHEPLRAHEHPMVLLTPDAVIETLNAALMRDPVALRTDPLVQRLAGMLERAGQRPPTPEEQDLARRNLERFAEIAQRGLVGH